MTVALLWFRRNLRLSDNSALLAAPIAPSRRAALRPPPTPGAQGPGMASLSWLNSSLASLDLQLRERGSALVRTGMPPAVLARLAEETGARAYTASATGRPRDSPRSALSASLAARGVALGSRRASCL